MSGQRLPAPKRPAHDPSLRECGLKNTHTRIAVLNVIRDSEGQHLSAEDIFRRLPAHGEDMAMATVYRVLASLERAGLVSRSMFDGGKAVYELDTGEHHDHLICVGCGRVAEFRDPQIEARQLAVAASRGFELTDHRLLLYGRCADCTATRNAEPG